MNRANPSAPFTIDTMRMLREQRRPMALAFGGALLIAVLYVMMCPKAYRSEAKLFVRVGRESVMLDPTATTGQVIALQETRENEINSIYELLKSRGLFEQVVSKLGIDPVLERDPTEQSPDQPPVTQAGFLARIKLLGPDDEIETAFRRFAKKISISVVKKSNVIAISYEGATPEWAQHALATYLDVAREAHIQANRTPGSQKFFAAQVAKLGTSLAELETRERDLKDSSGVSAFEDQRSIVMVRVGSLESRLLQAEAELETARAQIDAWQRQMASSRETIVTEEMTGFVNTTADKVREQLHVQEVSEQELLARLGTEHPDVISNRKQIEKLQAILDRETTDPQVTRGRNPAYEEIQLALLKQQAIAAGLEAELSKLVEQRTQAKAELTKINQHEVMLAGLDRQIDLEKSSYKKYAENLEQARIDSELQLESISNLNMLEAPTVARTPSRPQPMLTLLLGCAGGVAAAVGVGLVRELGRGKGAGPEVEIRHPLGGNGDLPHPAHPLYQTSET